MNFPTLMGINSGSAFLLGFILFLNNRKVNVKANKYLGLFVVTLGFTMLEIPLFYQKFHLQHPYLFEMIGLSRFLTAPYALYQCSLFYVYT
ncbi:hypothetical protein BXU10_09770 [Flavobacterium sp. LM4]|nr:hypothetical protein BXU10_09770 [Flavobacterium sp. LM4]